MEIACDESGYEGEKLVGGVTRVFAHASVRLSVEDADACVAELRRLIRSPATLYKANHVLRSKHRAVLLWLLGEDGPLAGRSQLHLVDKTRLLIDTVAATVFPDVDREHVDARFVDNPPLLQAANDVLRSRAETEVEAVFFDVLRDPGLEEVARERVKQFRERQPDVLPELDPLWPAILQAVDYWSSAVSVGQPTRLRDDPDAVYEARLSAARVERGEVRPVEIVHDRQTTLSTERIAELRQLAGGGLGGLTLHDSFVEPRVQVADFLAGVATRVTSERLQGRDDPEVIELLRPYVSSPAGRALLA